MPTINLTMQAYTNTASAKKSCTTSGGNTSCLVSTPHPATGGSSTSTKKAGFKYSESSTYVVVDGWQTWFKFTLPENLSVSNIKSAKIKFTAAADTTNFTYAIFAPAGSTKPSQFYNYGSTGMFDKTNKKTFSSTSTSATSYNIDITTIFKKCIERQNGNIAIAYPGSYYEHTRTLTFSGSPTLTYEVYTTACTPPTEVTFTHGDSGLVNQTSSIVKPTGSGDYVTDLVINWTGAQDGYDNPITGYKIYYKEINSEEFTTIDVSSLVETATINIGVSRGNTYLVFIQSIGTVEGYDSSLSDVYCSIQVNSLPSAPSATHTPARIGVNGTNKQKMTFESITPGADVDTSQTLSVYYSTSGEKILCSSSFTLTGLNDDLTISFFTFDGLEFSEARTYTILKNTPPTITTTGFVMTTIDSLSPSVNDQTFAKQISVAVPQVTFDPNYDSEDVKYRWYFVTGTAGLAPSTQKESYFNESQENIPSFQVTSSSNSAFINNFNQSYKVRLIVIDDVGDTAQTDTSNVFCIPPIPAIVSYNQKDDHNCSNTNPVHFDTGMRFYYQLNNTNTQYIGIEKSFVYGTKSNEITNDTITFDNRTHYDYDDVTLTDLTRGTQYYYKIKFTCDNITGYATSYNGNTADGYGRSFRAYNLSSLTNLSIAPTSGSVIKPYTQTQFTFYFSHGGILTSWISENDVSNTPNNIYSFKLIKDNNEYPIDLTLNSASINSGDVIATLALNDITINEWKALFSLTNNPNDLYQAGLVVTTTNGFGSSFESSPLAIDLNFVESYVSGHAGDAKIQIKTTDLTTQYVDIPTVLEPTVIANRYPLYQSQIIKFVISGIQTYAEQNVTINIREGIDGPIIQSDTCNGTTDWSGQSLNAKELEYICPPHENATTTVDYCAEIILENGNRWNITNKLNYCKYMRLNTSIISPQIIKIEENPENTFSITYKVVDFGGTDDSGFYQGGITVSAEHYRSQTTNGPYSHIDDTFYSASNMTANGKTDVVIVQSSHEFDPEPDILYFGLNIKIVANFLQINSLTPYGTTEYTTDVFQNLFTLYRLAPNLLYGKNFFVINSSSPRTNVDNRQILEIHKVSGRDKIFIGENNYGTITINDNSVEFDGFIISGGSWT